MQQVWHLKVTHIELCLHKIMMLAPKKKKNEKNIQKRFQVKKIEMKIVSINKAQFARLNDKRYCFLDGMVSFPYGHPKLKNVQKEKK